MITFKGAEIVKDETETSWLRIHGKEFWICDGDKRVQLKHVYTTRRGEAVFFSSLRNDVEFLERVAEEIKRITDALDEEVRVNKKRKRAFLEIIVTKEEDGSFVL